MKLVSVAEMREIEKAANRQGLPYEQMMENAGLGVADVVDRIYGAEGCRSAAGLVGPGNNGGDALVALTSLALQGWEASAYLVRPRAEGDELLEHFVEAGGKVLSAAGDPGLSALSEMLAGTEVLLDGVLGTGTKLPLKDDLALILAAAGKQSEGLAVVAVDCPSGVDCDSGEAADETIPADVTVCMAAYKQGLLKFPAFELAGRIEVVGIGLPDDLAEWQALQREVISAGQVKQALPVRKMDAHKGTFGTAVIAAGSVNYTGAALLAGKAAYRSGAGLVRLAVPGPLHTALAGHLPEATWLLLPHEMGVIAEGASDILMEHLEKASALLIGPGLGMEETTAGFIRRLFSGKPVHHARGGIGFLGTVEPVEGQADTPVLPPLVIDADGLKLLAKLDNWAKLVPAPAVLTPHPGEMSVLTGLPVEEIQADRLAVAERFAAEWGHVVVLKGALSIIAAPDGRTAVIPVASAALARAGTGDVLAGLICGLRAQGLGAFEAAWAGAWIHAQAGLAAAEWQGCEASVLAGDVLEAVPEVLEGLQS